MTDVVGALTEILGDRSRKQLGEAPLDEATFETRGAERSFPDRRNMCEGPKMGGSVTSVRNTEWLERALERGRGDDGLCFLAFRVCEIRAVLYGWVPSPCPGRDRAQS